MLAVPVTLAGASRGGCAIAIAGHPSAARTATGRDSIAPSSAGQSGAPQQIIHPAIAAQRVETGIQLQVIGELRVALVVRLIEAREGATAIAERCGTYPSA